MQVSQRFINKSIDEWRQRLQAVVKNNGAHIEHLTSYSFRRHWYDRSRSLVRNWFWGCIKFTWHDNVNTINWIALTFSSVCDYAHAWSAVAVLRRRIFCELSFSKVVYPHALNVVRCVINLYCTFSARSNSDRIFKIHQYLVKIWTRVWSLIFGPYDKLLSISSPNINRFSIFFTSTFCGKFVVKLLLNIPPHFNCVATLPCEI